MSFRRRIKLLKKTISGIMLILLLTSMLTLAFNVQPVKAEPKTWIVDDDGPADFHTIQEAIKAASPGDIIFVKTGTFYENVIVNKSVSIIGESRETTLIDGNGTAEAVIVAANNTMLSGFTIQSGSSFIAAVRLENVSHVTITNNTITNSFSGLAIAFSDFNTIVGNNITRNTFRDTFVNSSNNILRDNIIEGLYISKSINNTLVGNTIGSFMLSHSPNTTLRNNNFSVFGVYGETLSHFVQDIESSNTINGKPIYYWVNYENSEVPLDAGYVALIDCMNITVRGLNFENNIQSIIMFSTNNSRILNNNITNINEGLWVFSSYNNIVYQNNIEHTMYGIWLDDSLNNSIAINNIANNSRGIYFSHSHGNTVSGNNITANTDAGMWLWQSRKNAIYHNNFINNTRQVFSDHSRNIWDNGYPSGGNYWSDYTDVDLFSGSYQNETGGDGIGDSKFQVFFGPPEVWPFDNYPLMAPFNTFNAGIWNGTAYNVDIVSNSTLSNFNIDLPGKTVSFNITGAENQTGFCRITIPNVIVEDFWQGNYTVLFNDEPWPYRNWTDNTNTYIYVKYTYSTHQITIIPEFPTATTLLLIMLIVISIIVPVKRKVLRRRFPT